MFWVKLLALLFVALIAGGWMMGTALVVPAQRNLTASEYVAVEQANTSFGKRYYPIVVITSIILLITLLVLSRGDMRQMWLVGASLVLVVTALGFTGAKIVPLNTRVDTWSVQSPPSDWQQTRDAWHTYHRVRTALAVTAFILLSAAIVQGSTGTGKQTQSSSAKPSVTARS
jgi:uncharacterized membrane protein